MKSDEFTLALAQIRIEPGAGAQNLERARALIHEAAAKGSKLVLLPEAMPLGWTDLSARTDAAELDACRYMQMLRDEAQNFGIHLCSGWVEKEGGEIYNSAVLVSPKGELLLHHRKINELALAHSLYGLGRSLSVAETELGPIGLMICADGFARGQVLARSLGYMGAGLILSPSSWAVPPDHDNHRDPYGALWIDNYKPVAVDFRLWIASVSNVGPIRSGPWAGRKCIGSSMVLSPEGEVALRGAYGEGAEELLFCNARLWPRPARGDQWAERWGAS